MEAQIGIRAVGDPAQHAAGAWEKPAQAQKIVAIVGPSGAGKSTFARRVGTKFGSTVISQDDFLLPEGERAAPGLLAKYDWASLELVIGKLVEGKPAQFSPFHPGLRRRVGIAHVEPQPLLIVEGVAALFSSMIETNAHVRIYVDAPTRLRTQRQIERLDREGQYREIPREAVLAKIHGKKMSEEQIIREQVLRCEWLVDTSGPNLVLQRLPLDARDSRAA